MNRLICGAATAVVAGLFTVSAEASQLDYYVGLDGRPDQTGALINYQNPNYGRLTMLFAHWYPSVFNPSTPFQSNHYHRVGNYAHVVPSGFTAANPVPPGETLSTVFGNARLPEGTYPPITLLFGSGVFAGKFVSVDRPHDVSDTSTEYDNIRIASVHTMAAAAGADPGSSAASTTPEQAMYYSSRFGAGNTSRYTGAMTNATVGLKLISITPGLNIAEPDGDAILTSLNSVQTLGPGDTFDYSFAFWVDGTAAYLSQYSATFELVDQATNSPLPNSGQFRFDVQVVPEPASLSLAGLATVGLLARRRR